MVASAKSRLGVNSFWTGNFAEAATGYQQVRHNGMTISKSLGLIGPWHTVRALNDGFLGYLDRCRKALAEIVLHARGDSDIHIHFVAFALTHHACSHLLAGDELMAQSSADEAIAPSEEYGFEERAAIARCIRGIALAERELLDEGISEIQKGSLHLG